MKKIIALVLILSVLNSIGYAAYNITLNSVVEANICSDNVMTGTLIVSPPFSSTFTFRLKAEVWDGGQQIITYPNCGGSSGNNPAQIKIKSLSNAPFNCATLISFTPTNFYPSTNEYEWTVDINTSQNGCAPGSTIEIDFEYNVYLDCSLIPVNPTSGQQLSLIISGNTSTDIASFTASIPLPYIIDNKVPTQGNAVQVGGNYGQSTFMEFEYINNGYATVVIDIDFVDEYFQSCTNKPYDINRYELDEAGAGFNIVTFPTTTGITLDPNESVRIREYITITGCTQSPPTCNPLSQNISMKWRCHNAPPINAPYEAFCHECQHEYKTPFVFTYDLPQFALELLNTNPINADDLDNSCNGSLVTWNVIVRNESQYSTLKHLDIDFGNAAYGNNGLTVVYDNYLQGQTLIKSCATCTQTTGSISPSTITPAGSCATSGSLGNSIRDFAVDIEELTANEYVQFSFQTMKCCGLNINENINKALNQWVVTKTDAITGCNSVVTKPILATQNQDLIKNTSGGISGHSNIREDLDLQLAFSPNGIDADAPQIPSGQSYSYGSNAQKLEQNVEIGALFGDIADEQALKNSAGDVSGILRIKVHCDAGLLINQLSQTLNAPPLPIYGNYEVQLSYVSAGITTNLNPLTQFTAHEFTVDTFYPNPNNFIGSGCIPPNASCHYYPDCEGGDYYFYYDLTAMSAAAKAALFDYGNFQFFLTPCCPINDIADYEVSFSLLPNSNCYTFTPVPYNEPDCATCCWLPLGKRGHHLNVHCPGCQAPGAIVDDYVMQRNTFGYADDNGDRLRDGPRFSKGDPYYLAHINDLKLNAAVHGDNTIDYMTAHFQEGDPALSIGSNHPFDRGYTYNVLGSYAPPTGDMKAKAINLPVLQILRKIKYGGCDKMNLQITELELFVDRNNSSAGLPTNFCELCQEEFPKAKNQIDNFVTLFSFKPNIPLTNNFYEEIVTGDDKEMLFTFNISDVKNASLGVVNTAYNNYIDFPNYEYLESDQFRLKVKYRIDGNTYSTFFNYNVDDLHLISDITNWMWFTGTRKVLYPDTDPNHHGKFVGMPNIVYRNNDPLNGKNDMESAPQPPPNTGIAFDPLQISPTGYCPNCVEANQTNLGDAFKFYCETRGNTFNFYSSDFSMLADYSGSTLEIPNCSTITTLSNPKNCNKLINVKIETSFGRGRYGNGVMGKKDLFPFEYRTNSLIPNKFSLKNIPAGYSVVNLGTEVLSTYYSNGVNSTCFDGHTFTPTIIANEIIIDQSLNINPTNPNAFNCLPTTLPPNYSSNDILMSDEYIDERFYINLSPDCNASGTTKTFASSDAIGTFWDNNYLCPANSTLPIGVGSCATETEDINESGYLEWKGVNPNLQVVFNPSSIIAINNDVCWDFSVSNFNASGVITTVAPNVYIEVPTIPGTAITNWSMVNVNYSGLQVANVGMISLGLTGVFPLFPLTSTTPAGTMLPALPVGPNLLTGRLCGTYSSCTGSQSLNANWGWNCTDDFNPATRCSTNQATINVTPIFPDVKVVHNSQTVVTPQGGGATMCAPNHSMSVSFRNNAQGEAVVRRLTLGNAQNFQIGSIKIYDCNGSGPYNVTNVISANEWEIEPALLATQLLWNTGANPHQNMRLNDCIRVQIEFTPLCQTLEEIILPEVIIGYNPFCNDDPNPAVLPLKDIGAAFVPLTVIGSDCTDCFSISKVPSTSTAADGTEMIHYTVNICSNNDPGIANVYTVTVNEGVPGAIGYPLGYSPNPLIFDPFAGGTGTINESFNYPHQNNTIPSLFCKAIIFSNNSTIEGTLTLTAGATNPICNTVFLTDVSTGNVFRSNDACINVFGNCTDLYPTIPPSNIIPSGSINLPTGLTGDIIVQGLLTVNNYDSWSNYNFYMEPGAEIKVSAGTSLGLFMVNMEGCTKMWKGITLEVAQGLGGAKFYAGRTNIKDAYHAIEANTATVLSLSDTYFTDNFVGIYGVPVLSTAKGNSAAMSFYYVGFAGSGAMKEMYSCPTCETVSREFPKAGMELYDMTLNLPSGQGVNTFFNMSNGILGYRSRLRIGSSTFTKIKADQVYNVTGAGQYNYNGSAIYGMGGYRAGFIYQEGWGNTTGSQITFENCDYGITADDIELISSNNIMTDMKTGYHSRFGKRQVVIRDNVIDSKETSIEMFMYDELRLMNITKNDITYGDAVNAAPFSYGIRVEGANMAFTDFFYIYRNTINSRGSNAWGGIFANSTAGLHIIENNITLPDNSINLAGIAITNAFLTGSLTSTGIIASCNVISGGGNYNPHSTQAAISLFSATNPEIACNTLDATDNGLYVLGNISGGNARFRSNNFNTHVNGLRYGRFATGVPPQNYMGNRWYAGAVAGGLNAKDESASPTICEVNMTTPPIIASFLPSSQLPANWFQPGSTQTNKTCFTPTNYCASFNPPQIISNVTDMDRLVAVDGLENDPYTDETRWILKKELYEKIAENPGMLSEMMLSQFYFNSQAETYAQLAPIEDAKAELYGIDSIADTTITTQQLLIEQDMDALTAQMKLLDTAIVYNDTVAVPLLLDNIETIAESIKDKGKVADDIASNQLAEQATDADAILVENDMLSGNATIEENEIIVNDIYLSTIAKGNYVFTADQITLLRDIAMQCPLSGGNAVFRARAMFALVDKTLHYDNFAICAEEGITLRKGKTNDKSFNAVLYPNPANDNVTIAYNLPERESGKFVLHNLTGQMVIELMVKGGSSSQIISTKALVPGVYHYALICNGNGIDNGKLVIVR